MTTQKFRDTQIQTELYEQMNPSAVPDDMLHPWTPGNIRLNEDMAQFILAIELLTKDWYPEYKETINWFIPRLSELNIDIDAFARVQAIEALGISTPQTGLPQEEKKKGLFGLFGKK